MKPIQLVLAAGRKRGEAPATRTWAGAPWLKTTLVQVTWTAVRKEDSYFHAQFLRLKVIAVPSVLICQAWDRFSHRSYPLRSASNGGSGERSGPPETVGPAAVNLAWSFSA